ncbi:hypothetical protein [uncultured Robinsoniella sp.]|uniref:hypothetical protein n=1 Tax=uncultured Robinsoniella sp. TaxID=904190 RepID=UPI00374F01E6
MREVVVKKVKFDSTDYCDHRYSFMLIKIDHFYHEIQFETVGGAAPNIKAVLNFLLTDKDVRQELIWACKEYKRKYPIFFKYHEGMSGARNITLCYSKVSHDWAASYKPKQKTAYNLHISCANKLNDGINDIFSGDLLDLINFFIKEEEIHCERYQFLENLDHIKTKLFKRKHYQYLRYRHKELFTVDSLCYSKK